ncbi:MAG: hypothetical protein ACE37N_02920 [Pseudohongiellaceae bacterium]
MKFTQASVIYTVRKVLAAFVVVLLSACATQPATVPDTTVLTEIQNTMERAAETTRETADEMSEDDSDLLNELIPSLSLDEELLAPVEERVSISSPNLPADVFFNSLVADTEYGVVQRGCRRQYQP